MKKLSLIRAMETLTNQLKINPEIPSFDNFYTDEACSKQTGMLVDRTTNEQQIANKFTALKD